MCECIHPAQLELKLELELKLQLFRWAKKVG